MVAETGSPSFQNTADDSSFSFRNIDIFEMYKAFSLVTSNAVGLDSISIKFIKLLLPINEFYILHIFNHILTTSIFPTSWKIGKIIPIPKVSNPKIINDYRPISILPAMSKVMEHIMSRQITSYLKSCFLLNDFQSAYRPGHSTSSAILTVIDDIRRKTDSGKLTVLVLLDFSKAFDSIDHLLLQNKLRSIFKFDTSSCHLISSYLTERLQITYIGNLKSDVIKINSGVPQGSVLGPLLFTMYINDLTNSINSCSYHLYADDLQIYLSCNIRDISYCIATINRDIENINLWSKSNNLQLNAKKTQAIVLYSSIISHDNFPRICVSDTAIPFSNYVKNLGVIISSDLSWDNHIKALCKTVNFSLSRLWLITKHANSDLKSKLVLSYIIPHILYASYVLYGMKEYNFKKIELLINSCIRYIYGLRKFDHISKYKNSIFGCSLKDYYDFRNCIFIYNILKSSEPNYISCKLKRLTSVRANNIELPVNRTNILNSSFFVRGISFWNMLPLEIKTSPSLKKFKTSYKNYHNFKK